MKPARILLPLSTFLMRLGAAFYIYLTHFDYILNPNFQQFHFYLSSIFIIFGLLFVFGAFARKQTLTVISSLILFLLCLYEVVTFSGSPETLSFVSLVLFGTIVLFFVTNGNKIR